MKKTSCCKKNSTENRSATGVPRRLSISCGDCYKMLVNWLFLFKKAYSVEPGLYFTGESYDKQAPLLVTCNFLSTVILLYRTLKGVNARLLIIDTEGINVWCSSGKGKFSAEEILNTLEMYDKNILSEREEIEIILPKLSLSGVRLKTLRENNVKVIIGPVRARGLKQYLETPPYKDRTEDAVHFDMRARFYVMVPGMIQVLQYAIIVAGLLCLFNVIFQKGLFWQVIPVALVIVIIYPLLFPWLPGKRFAVKGISLAMICSFWGLYLFMIKNIALPLMGFYVALIWGTCIFFALDFTGNSAVSNYSNVKKEIIQFLPISAIFYIIALVFYFIEVTSS